MQYLAYAFILMFSVHSHSETTYAWWLTEEIELTEIDIDGISLTDVDPSFIKVGFPTINQLPKNKTLGIEEIKKGDFKFKISGEFSNAPSDNVALVGAFIDNNNVKGRFILIYDFKTKKVMYFHKRSGIAGFLFLYVYENKLHWSGCLYCGDINPISWDGVQFKRDDSDDGEY
jgi:hypothetical protein